MDIDEKLRDKDRAVLHYIKGGRDDIQKITEATTLENHEVNYCFTKLEKLGLIQVSKPSGTVTRFINGQKRVFEHPKQAELTETGQGYLGQTDQKLSQYDDLTNEQLVEKIHRLEQQVNQLEQKLNLFHKQVQDQL